jgi:hypothetical protein
MAAREIKFLVDARDRMLHGIDRVDDAMHATRAAVEEGILAGLLSAGEVATILMGPSVGFPPMTPSRSTA